MLPHYPLLAGVLLLAALVPDILTPHTLQIRLNNSLLILHKTQLKLVIKSSSGHSLYKVERFLYMELGFAVRSVLVPSEGRAHQVIKAGIPEVGHDIMAPAKSVQFILLLGRLDLVNIRSLNQTMSCKLICLEFRSKNKRQE